MGNDGDKSIISNFKNSIKKKKYYRDLWKWHEDYKLNPHR